MLDESGSKVDTSFAAYVVRHALSKLTTNETPSAPKTTPKELWPPDYNQVLLWRQIQQSRLDDDEEMVESAKAYYAKNPVDFINHWCNTYDPRNQSTGRPTRMPFILFPRQARLVDFLVECIRNETGALIEKSRDMGATWLCCSLSVWMFLFWKGSAIGWGSRKQELVDRIGDPSSIFEKLRMVLRDLPEVFLPKGFSFDRHTHFMRIVNPENGSSIIGETGHNIGRGGRTLVYFKDEAAYYERPEMIEAALMDNTRCQVDISSVSGMGNVFHRKREAGIDWSPGDAVKKGYTNVFVLDWSDHPEKTQEWYNERKRKAIGDGLGHVFAREIDRDYSAAVEGVIIPSEWLNAVVDAHIKLGFDDSDGQWIAGLDVADGGRDTNALTKRKGMIARKVDEWSERDVGVTTRRALVNCSKTTPCHLYYDCVGIGAGVKAEANRLIEEGDFPKSIYLSPWNAGAAVLNPHEHINPNDKDSPKNGEYFGNMKAQAWWHLRTLCYNTYRAVEEGIAWKKGEVISIDSSIPLLHKLKKELSQPTMGQNSQLKLIVNKTPEGTKSPNLADSFVQCYFPIPVARKRVFSFSAPIVVTSR